MLLSPEHVRWVLIGPPSLAFNQGWIVAYCVGVEGQFDELVCQERLQPGQDLHCCVVFGLQITF